MCIVFCTLVITNTSNSYNKILLHLQVKKMYHGKCNFICMNEFNRLKLFIPFIFLLCLYKSIIYVEKHYIATFESKHSQVSNNFKFSEIDDIKNHKRGMWNLKVIYMLSSVYLHVTVHIKVLTKTAAKMEKNRSKSIGLIILPFVH